MRARAVSPESLVQIGNEPWVDPGRGVWVEDGIAWVPVLEGYPFDREVPERHIYNGRGFFMIGDVAVVHGSRPSPGEVEGIVRFRHPRGVLWIKSLSAITRIPKTEILWGDAGEVVHREEGYLYHLDPQKIMFSQGNREEKARIAKLIREENHGERVADMFAGIGYFTIPMAGSGARVHAMEINPVSYEFLKRNIAANHLGDRVTASCGDCRDLLSGYYDRVVMGHFDAVNMLPSVFPHVNAGSIFHVHSIGDATNAIRSMVEGAGFSASIEVHKVKKYRPHAWHLVQDVTLS